MQIDLSSEEQGDEESLNFCLRLTTDPEKI